MREFHRALLAYDGSTAAHRVRETLARLAVALNLEVIAAHLCEPGKDKTCLARAGEYLQRHSVRYETVYLEGDSHIALLKLAGERECDLLAMGAFTDRVVEAQGLGTTTEAVLRLSRIPILVHR